MPWANPLVMTIYDYIWNLENLYVFGCVVFFSFHGFHGVFTSKSRVFHVIFTVFHGLHFFKVVSCFDDLSLCQGFANNYPFQPLFPNTPSKLECSDHSSIHLN